MQTGMARATGDAREACDQTHERQLVAEWSVATISSLVYQQGLRDKKSPDKPRSASSVIVVN